MLILLKGVNTTGIIAWIIFGALVGWIASIFIGKNAQMGMLANIATGIAGAFLAGFTLKFFGIQGVTGFNLHSIIVAVGGATALLYILEKWKK